MVFHRPWLFAFASIALTLPCRQASAGVTDAFAAPLNAGAPSVGSLIRSTTFPKRVLGAGFSIPLVHSMRATRCGKDAYSIVILSDNNYGNLDIFDQNGSMIGQSKGVAGWGAAAKGCDMIAWGSSTYGVIVAKVTPSAIVTTAQLTPSAFGSGSDAYGITIDSEGDVYATNWPYNVIDYWSSRTIKSYRGVPLKPDVSVTPVGFKKTSYLAADRNVIYADGLDENYNMILATVAFPTGSTEILQNAIANTCGGYPGGIAVDSRHEVLVDNEYGTITGYRRGVGQPNESFTYNFYREGSGYNCEGGDFYAGIALSYDQSNLWAADQTYYYDGLYAGTLGVGLTNPLGGYSGGTPINDNELYYGVAASSAPRL
jgi:hypothetical protein